MQPVICPKCSPQLAKLREYAACGLKHIMALAEEMKTDTDTLSDDLKPYGEAMTKIIMEVLIESYVESLRLISELSLQEITRAALPPNQQTEPDSLQRSSSDEI
jgi:hypothetical protein